MQFAEANHANRREVREDPSGAFLHQIYLQAIIDGPAALQTLEVAQCVLETTGDTLLHLVAAHGHRDAPAMVEYVICSAGLSVNAMVRAFSRCIFFRSGITTDTVFPSAISIQNKHMKTALHYASEHNFPHVCRTLLKLGADVSMACQTASPTTPWQTPLYLALFRETPHFEVVDVLLRAPRSIVEPIHPKFARCDTTASVHNVALADWNADVVDRLVDAYPQAVGLYLDHFVVQASGSGGERVHRFHEVVQTCTDLEKIIASASRGPKPESPQDSRLPIATHPVIRNALHIKWKVGPFGST